MLVEVFRLLKINADFNQPMHSSIYDLWGFYENAETSEDILTITGPQGRINRVIWGPLNKTIISAGEDATIRIWDAEVCLNFWIFGSPYELF